MKKRKEGRKENTEHFAVNYGSGNSACGKDFEEKRRTIPSPTRCGETM